MDAKPVRLKVLLQHRHLQTHRAFCREYDRIAAKADPTLRGGWPSKAQFYRWLSGELVGLPYPDHCRILESMFPGWKVNQLFQAHEGGNEFVSEPQSAATLTNVLNSIKRGLQASANGQAGWGSDVLAESRTVSSPNVTFPLAVAAPGAETEEAPAQRIARSLVALSKRLRLCDAEIARLAKRPRTLSAPTTLATLSSP